MHFTSQPAIFILQRFHFSKLSIKCISKIDFKCIIIALPISLQCFVPSFVESCMSKINKKRKMCCTNESTQFQVHVFYLRLCHKKILKEGACCKSPYPRIFPFPLWRSQNAHNRVLVHIVSASTVIIWNIGTDRSEQTVQTQIRLLLKEQSDQCLLCLLFCLHLLNAILHCKIQLFHL